MYFARARSESFKHPGVSWDVFNRMLIDHLGPVRFSELDPSHYSFIHNLVFVFYPSNFNTVI